MPREDGTIIITPHDSDRTVMVKTVQCRHCGRHWQWIKGSGKRRGYCTRCGGITCGSSKCDPCVPHEQQLENVEKGKMIGFRPVVVNVPSFLSRDR